MPLGPVWLALVFSTCPFKRFEFDVLSIISSFVLIFIYIGALLVKLHGDLQTNFAVYIGAPLTLQDVSTTVHSTLSFDSADSIVTIIAASTAFVVAIVVLALVHHLWTDSRVQTFRVRDGAVPDLTLQKGTKWHLFLSHGAPRLLEPRQMPNHAPNT